MKLKFNISALTTWTAFALSVLSLTYSLYVDHKIKMSDIQNSNYCYCKKVPSKQEVQSTTKFLSKKGLSDKAIDTVRTQNTFSN